jgi:hypothetical protein
VVVTFAPNLNFERDREKRVSAILGQR